VNAGRYIRKLVKDLAKAGTIPNIAVAKMKEMNGQNLPTKIPKNVSMKYMAHWPAGR